MKIQLSIIAIVALSNQLAFADPASKTAAQQTTDANQTAMYDNMTTTTNTLPLLSDEVGSSLQSKLEAQMEFDLGPRPSSEHAIASID